MESFVSFSRKFLLASLVAIVSACGGGGDGGGGSAAPNIGVFYDGPVDGIDFKTATQSGITANGGQFKYLDGERVTFSIGMTTLGARAAKAVITPVDLIAGATDHTHPTVIKMVQLILSLADDSSAATLNIGATKKTAMQNTAIDLVADPASFEIAVKAIPGVILVKDMIAQNHMASTLAALDFKQLESMKVAINQTVNGRRCLSVANCSYHPLGVKACGGPNEFLVYCKEALDEASLLSAIEQYNEFNRHLNTKHQVLSTCDITPMPQEPLLVNGMCVAK